MDAVRAEISDMASNGNKDGLKSIAKEFKGSDAEKEATEALKKLS